MASKKYNRRYLLTIDTLADITVSMVEHHKVLNSTRTLNFIDHYRAYLEHNVAEALSDNPLVKFDRFITDQQLLNAAATYIALDEGEQLKAPQALKVIPLKVLRTDLNREDGQQLFRQG